jgi:hypothetical protein
MPEVFSRIVTWTRSGELTFDVAKVPLSDIEIAGNAPTYEAAGSS